MRPELMTATLAQGEAASVSQPLLWLSRRPSLLP